MRRITHAMKMAVMEVVGGHFRPEFINRIDETVVFHPLARAQIRAIAPFSSIYLRKRLDDRDLDLKSAMRLWITWARPASIRCTVRGR